MPNIEDLEYITEKFNAAKNIAQINEVNNVCVQRFARHMSCKLELAQEHGRDGWHDSLSISDKQLVELFVEHLRKGNPDNFLDLANLLMMMWYRDIHPARLRLAVKPQEGA